MIGGRSCLQHYFTMCNLYTCSKIMASPETVYPERCIPPCLAAWHWRSLSWPPPGRRKTLAWGLGRMQGLQEGQGLWPLLRNHCCGRSVGGGHWEVRCQRKMGPCPEVALEYWRGARWGRCPKSKLRRSRWLGTRSPAPARSVNDPSP